MKQYDVAVIGGGPGGYVAAGRAAELGLKTALIEKDTLGGVCVNVGCIPTKALLKNADVARLVRKEAKTFGVTFENAALDYGAAVARSRKVSERLSKGVGLLMKKKGVDVYAGEGSFKTADTLAVRMNDGTVEAISAKNVIVATGTRPAEIGGIRFDGERILNYRQAILRPELPRSVIVIGGGALGVEFASVWAAYGAEATIVEMMSTLIPGDDPDAAVELAKQFKRSGIKVLTGHKLKSALSSENGASVTLEHGADEVTLNADHVLIAIGFRPNTEALMLENAGVETDSRGWIRTGEFGRTNVESIYAIGDVSGKIQLAHVASALGRIAAEKIAGRSPAGYDPDQVPHATYSIPQVAAVGLTQPEAEKRGIPVIVGKADFIANGKAIGLDDYAGWAKLVCHAGTGVVLGGTVIGSEASELLPEIALAVRLKLKAADIAMTIHAHPTLSEVLMDAALDAVSKLEK